MTTSKVDLSENFVLMRSRHRQAKQTQRGRLTSALLDKSAGHKCNERKTEKKKQGKKKEQVLLQFYLRNCPDRTIEWRTQ